MLHHRHTRLAIVAAAVALVLSVLAMCGQVRADAVTAQAPANCGIAIHGGAGTIERGSMTPEMEAEYTAALNTALRAGHAVLDRGGSSLDAVQAAIRVLEDSPLFNAGKGAVFTAAGKNELDASIMDGRNRMAGAVASLRHVKNPIDLARLVMEKSPHVMMVGEGAEAFATERGMELVPESYFHTERRWRGWEQRREEERRRGGVPRDTTAMDADPGNDPERKFGTVGAVALDRAGHLAAGTSTGGTSDKRWGRVGDAPIIGAGTYADDRCGAVSATGQGEFFIRAVVAYDICAIALYARIPLRDAAHRVIMEKLVRMGGEGGVVAMDPQGVPSFPFNTSGMYRGYLGRDGKPFIGIYRD
ncbi:MAG: isoaspartyl peptidase/L-asparaginase [Gemmatimonadetes bacterium]|nr:isoaspartyl peptidase/L-asparaginase [Gemmatimonadota bacterium]